MISAPPVLYRTRHLQHSKIRPPSIARPIMADSNVPTGQPLPVQPLPIQPLPAESLPPQPAAPYAPIFGMTFGQILERVFHLLRAHWKPFIVIGLLPLGFLLAFESIFFGVLYLAGAFTRPTPQLNNTAVLWTVFPAGLLFLPVMLLVYGLYYGATTYASLQADHGLPVTAGDALRHAWSCIGRYSWLMLLRSLIVAIPAIVMMIVVLIAVPLVTLVPNAANNPALLFLLIPLGILFFLGFIVYSIYMGLRLSLAFTACTHENLTAMQSIKRSGVLTRGAKGRIFLVLLVIYAISYAVILVFYLVGIVVIAIGAVASIGNIQHASPLGIALIAIAGLVVLVFFFLWVALLLAAYSLAFAVLYRDQCLRKDPPAFAPAAVVSPL